MKQLLVGLTIGMMALPALARPEFLGSVRLSRTGSTQLIRVANCRPGDRMDAVRLIVRNQPAYLDSMAVQFRNGRVQNFRFRQQVPGNTQTRWLDLRGNGHCINAIQIAGQSLNLLQKATVEVYGRVQNMGGGNGGGWPGGGNGGGNGDGWPGDDDNDGGHNGGGHGGGGHGGGGNHGG